MRRDPQTTLRDAIDATEDIVTMHWATLQPRLHQREGRVPPETSTPTGVVPLILALL